MAAILLLEDFLDQLELGRDPETPFTWLIGAGMSISAGMPLAVDIGWRILLFHYLWKERSRPWKQEADASLAYAEDLDDFMAWYEAKDAVNDSLLKLLKENAEAWMRTKDGLHDVTSEKADFYPEVFRTFLRNEVNQHRFLTRIFRQGKGVNIAHLALAGILRDHSDYGSTVFTTNFDDLLLKALLYLDHTARVHGDLLALEQTYLKHTYPQIVHLHGRHTSYRTASTAEQMRSLDAVIKSAFTSQIRNSHLIVVGYSGWDDFVMQTLHGWKDDRSLLKGDLYWVPFKSEDHLLANARAFLDHCPSGRAHLVVSPNRDLNADMFMLAVADRINRRAGGFEVYRAEISKNALKQHGFTLAQLEQYPPHDPNSAVTAVKELLQEYRNGTVIDLEKRLSTAAKLVEPADVPPGVKAQVGWLLGLLEMMRGDFQKAVSHLEQCLELRGRIEAPQDRAHLIFNAKIHRALGECHLRRYDHGLAETSLTASERLAQANEDGISRAAAKLHLAEIALREAKVDKAQTILNRAEEQAGDNVPGWIKAEFHRLRGDIHITRSEGDAARTQYELCLAGVRAR